MEKTPLIAVIVPIYKVEKYLSRCIESILQQSFTDFELLLIDDGSPDNCGAICEDWAKKDNRIRVFHQKNAGLSAARNKGLDNARARYAAFVDSDDYVSEQYLTHLYNLIPTENLGFGYTVQGYIRYKENGDIIKKMSFTPYIYTLKEISSLFTGDEIYNMFSACAKLFDCQFLNKNKLRFNTTLRFSEDVLFILECLVNCDYISVGDKADYNYINYAGTMSKVVTPFKSEYETYISCKRIIKQIIVNKKMTSIEQQGIFKSIHLLFCRTLKSDYHHFGTVSGEDRRQNLHCLVNENMDFLSNYYYPDYVIDKIGRFLLMHRSVYLYDLFLSILFKLKVKKMFCPPGAF